jgi:tetratricopeptide (TPR) repeat protein
MKKFATFAISGFLILTVGGLRAEGQFLSARQSTASENRSGADPQAEDELQQGTALSRRGAFAEAIPHLLAARGHVSNEYAASFNLALCYVGAGRPAEAIAVLEELRAGGHDNADVNNLLAQAYVAEGQDAKALDSLRRAARATPTSEKLYLFVADACMSKQDYALGLQTVDLGLRQIPRSAWLHYERGMFLTQMGEFDRGRSDFDRAADLAPESDPAYLARAEKAMFEGNTAKAIRVAREGIRQGHEHFLLLALLAEALVRSGVAPGQPEFSEARLALKKSIAERPNYAGSQLLLGRLYLQENEPGEALTYLQAAQQLNPSNPAVYASLAVAYRKTGDSSQEQAALAALARLNQEQAEKIRRAPGDSKQAYGGR